MNILVVDDQRIFLESITILLRQQFSGATISTATSGEEALEMVIHQRPDVILLDVNMPGMNGLDVAEFITKNYPRIKLIVLTSVMGGAMVLSLSKIVHGFLFKNIDGQELKKCFDLVMNNKTYFCEGATQRILNNIKTFDKLPGVRFDKREVMIIELLAAGKTSQQISTILGIKEKTINSYREGLLRKTHTKNSIELVAFAFYNGLI